MQTKVVLFSEASYKQTRLLHDISYYTFSPTTPLVYYSEQWNKRLYVVSYCPSEKSFLSTDLSICTPVQIQCNIHITFLQYRRALSFETSS